MKTINIEKFEERMETILSEIFRGVCGGLGETMVDLAPVRTGALRASIKVDPTDFNENETDLTGDKTKAEINKKLNSKKLGDSFEIGTVAPYAEVIEYGSSDQAPSGFLRIAEISLPNIEQNVKRRIEKI
jgi:hypothetical protein